MIETWTPIAGYESLYEVSDLGNVRRIGRATGATVGRILKPKIDHRGYRGLTLYDSNHKPKYHKICRLVAAAFVRNPDNKPTVNHMDGVKLNDSASNLEWATSSEQVLHAYKMGLAKPTQGEINGTSKMTDETVLAIRRKYQTGNHTYVELGEEFGVDMSTIGRIVRGDTWGHVL